MGVAAARPACIRGSLTKLWNRQRNERDAEPQCHVLVRAVGCVAASTGFFLASAVRRSHTGTFLCFSTLGACAGGCASAARADGRADDSDGGGDGRSCRGCVACAGMEATPRCWWWAGPFSFSDWGSRFHSEEMLLRLRTVAAGATSFSRTDGVRLWTSGRGLPAAGAGERPPADSPTSNMLVDFRSSAKGPSAGLPVWRRGSRKDPMPSRLESGGDVTLGTAACAAALRS